MIMMKNSDKKQESDDKNLKERLKNLMEIYKKLEKKN